MPNAIFEVAFDQVSDRGGFFFSKGHGGGYVGSDFLYFNATAAEITTALEAMSNIGAGNVLATYSGDFLTLTITFQAALANTDIENFAFANGNGGQEPLLVLTPYTITNQVAGTAGPPHTFRLQKTVDVNTGYFRLKRGASNMSGVLAWDAGAATIQASMTGVGQNYTVTDMTTYFQFTRNVNGSNGTFTVDNTSADPLNPIGNLTVVTLTEVQAGGPAPVAGGRRRNRRRMTAG